MASGKLYPNRLELHSESGKPDLIFMDQIEDVASDYVTVKVGEYKNKRKSTYR